MWSHKGSGLELGTGWECWQRAGNLFSRICATSDPLPCRRRANSTLWRNPRMLQEPWMGFFQHKLKFLCFPGIAPVGTNICNQIKSSHSKRSQQETLRLQSPQTLRGSGDGSLGKRLWAGKRDSRDSLPPRGVT